jgi:hypothetical protein
VSNHVRQQIREYVAGTVLAGLTTTGSNVFQSRPDSQPLPSASLPALLVYTEGEDDTAETIGFPPRMTRDMRLRIAAVVEQNADFDDKIDTIIKEVETAINANRTAFTANNLARGGIFLDAIDDPEFTGAGRTTVGVVAMRWIARYMTTSDAPTVSL